MALEEDETAPSLSQEVEALLSALPELLRTVVRLTCWRAGRSG
jgi:hypothetical protein